MESEKHEESSASQQTQPQTVLEIVSNPQPNQEPSVLTQEKKDTCKLYYLICIKISNSGSKNI